MFPYANVVGCLMYAIVLTRPDISHALSTVSGYMAAPGKEHWQAVIWILKGTINYGLLYKKSDGVYDGIWGYVYPNFVRDFDTRRSLTGCLFMRKGYLTN